MKKSVERTKTNGKKCQKLSFRDRCLLRSAPWRILHDVIIYCTRCVRGYCAAASLVTFDGHGRAHTYARGITQCQLIYNAYNCGGAWLCICRTRRSCRCCYCELEKADLYCTTSWQQAAAAAATLLMHMYAREQQQQQQYAHAAVQHLDARHSTQRIDPHDSCVVVVVVVVVAENEQQQLRCCFAGGGSNDNNSGSSEQQLRGDGGDPVVAVTNVDRVGAAPCRAKSSRDSRIIITRVSTRATRAPSVSDAPKRPPRSASTTNNRSDPLYVFNKIAVRHLIERTVRVFGIRVWPYVAFSTAGHAKLDFSIIHFEVKSYSSKVYIVIFLFKLWYEWSNLFAKGLLSVLLDLQNTGKLRYTSMTKNVFFRTFFSAQNAFLDTGFPFARGHKLLRGGRREKIHTPPYIHRPVRLDWCAFSLSRLSISGVMHRSPSAVYFPRFKARSSCCYIDVYCARVRRAPVFLPYFFYSSLARSASAHFSIIALHERTRCITSATALYSPAARTRQQIIDF
ncbi:unnamed protein product [Trichogramma brassicae]|uniref:Uncharacterized protein n=1 Tax=Trichogramma brassicae TaxID=86971 RepID=A0A6H5IG50_9HYME|nr:unnamed protein product [Trichogramma brassicae]